MISMKAVGSSAEAGKYFEKDNYYTKEQGYEHSRWSCKGADELGLSGHVKKEDFVIVLDGKVEGQQLGKQVKNEKGETVRDHRAGIDLTFSAPKSVSLVAEVGGDARVRAAHEAAVAKAMGYLEKNASLARVTKGGQTAIEKTGNLVVAKFEHNTTREAGNGLVDPQTHTHCVIANATKCADGEWRSLSNEALFTHRTTADAIYRSELATQLHSAGYAVEAKPNGQFEIKGISKAQLDHFSQRREEMKENLADKGVDIDKASAKQRQVANLETREAKGDIDHDRLKAEWQGRAKDQGLDINGMVAEARAKREGEQPARVESIPGKQSIQYAVDKLTERQSVVEERDILREALNHGMGKTSAGSAMAALKDMKKNGGLIDTADGRITTPGAIKEELKMIDSIKRGTGTTAAIAGKAKIEGGIAKFEERAGFLLNDGQREAVTLIAGSKDRFVGVQGDAGTGKTTMLEAVKQIAEREGYNVRGMSISTDASQVLQKETGIKSTTVADFMNTERNMEGARRAALERIEARARGGAGFKAKDTRGIAGAKSFHTTKDGAVLTSALHFTGGWRKAGSIEAVLYKAGKLGEAALNEHKARADDKAMVAPRKELWVVDEGGLLGQKDANAILKAAERAGAKVVVVGDEKQLSAVNAGKPFDVAQRDGGMATAKMDEINRQKTDQLKAAVADVANGRHAEALSKLDTIEVKDDKKLIGKVVADIAGKTPEQREKSLVLTATNADRREINDGVREALKARGEIKGPAANGEVLVSKGWTAAETKHAGNYQPGDVVRFGRTYEGVGVQKGEYARVEGADRAGKVTLKTDAGKLVTWEPAKNSKVEAYRAESREIQAGDKIKVTRNGDGLVNGHSGHVEKVSGNLATVKMQSGESVKFDLAKDRHWDHGYAQTIHSSQGKTTEAVSIHINTNSKAAMGDRAFYVAATRSKFEATVYTNDRAAAEKLVGRKMEKTSATESMRAPAPRESTKIARDTTTKAPVSHAKTPGEKGRPADALRATVADIKQARAQGQEASMTAGRSKQKPHGTTASRGQIKKKIDGPSQSQNQSQSQSRSQSGGRGR